MSEGQDKERLSKHWPVTHHGDASICYPDSMDKAEG